MLPSPKPVTASWVTAPLLRPPQLAQSIVLAMLLHLWLVLVLGSAPGGSARPGEGVWGRVGGVIDVRLSGLLGERPAVAEPAAPLTPTGPVGSARQERFGGAVREPSPVEPPEATAPGAVRLGRWNSRAGDAEARTPPNRITALPGEAARPVPADTNLALQPMPTRPAAQPAPAPPLPAPVIEPAPAPAPVLAPAPVVAPVLAPMPAPTPLAAPEAGVPRTEATPAPTPTPTPTPASPQASALQPTTPQAATPTAASPANTANSASTPAPNPATYPATYPAASGSPDAGSRVGRDVATPASTPAAAARAPLNLSLPRGAALSRQGASGLLSMVPAPPDRKTKLQEELEAAAKADCRKAYAGAGLLAAVPLVIDAARDKGCRW